MSKHTPGPWTVGGWSDTDVVVPPKRVRLHDGSEGWAVSIVASVHNPGTDDFSKLVQDKSDEGSDPVVKANARLIAAAPDLLEALEELADLKIAKDSGFYEFSEDAYRQREEAVWDRARAALAKARGES